MITTDILRKIVGGRPPDENMESVARGLADHGKMAGLDRPHRLAHYVAQVAHESGRFKYDREVWGPTKAQLKYEGREDLGNVQPGDGKKFSGHGPMQVTGRYNHAKFRDWCRKVIDPKAPDFEDKPEMINTEPWEGLSPIWYWDASSLNVLADENNIEAVTRKINGGLNGYPDRMLLYTRAALVLMGYDLEEGIVARFQRDVGFTKDQQDDIAGTQTRKALHAVLYMMGDVILPPSDTTVEPPPVVLKPVVDPKVARMRALVREMDALLTDMEGVDDG